MTGAYTQACLAILIHFHAQTGADDAERCAIMVFFTHHNHCMQDYGSTKHKQQSCQPMTFCLLSTQQIQALLTLFSKFFSFFPQGTCLLPVSSSCLSLHETYHPLCTPFPKSVIQKMHTVHEKHMMTNRNITLVAALFQEACIQAPIGNAFQHYMSGQSAPIIKMSYVMFIRNYY